jgi:SAM-dependent methyltransferase
MSDERATAFKGTFAELYDRYLVPMNFAPYAEILAERVKAFEPQTVLETAAGTGVVTQALRRKLPTAVVVTATDLSQPMIDLARTKSYMANVTWRQADATKLPFPDAGFDIVVCQFGVMFFPDKQASSREAFRVLRHGGKYLFAVWDSWAEMPTAPLGIAAKVVGEMLGRDPVSLLNPPYHDEATIRADLAAASFVNVKAEQISLPVKAKSARDAAIITVHGSLIANAVEATAPGRLDEATDAVEQALHSQFGAGEIVGANCAILVTAEKV